MIPGDLSILKTLLTTGLLKSVSIKIVFLPILAKVIAKFATVVVLPSPGPALDTIRDFNSDFELVKTIQSEKIDISSNNWVIYNPTTTIDNISKDIEGNIQLNSNFNSEKINNLFSNISSFDLFKLYDLKSDYEKFGYSTDEINIQLLRLYTTPIFYGILSILSVVIMLNFIKNKPLLFHLICGVMLSVIIYYINFIFNSLGINGKIPLNLSILFPFFLITIFSLIGLIKINEK